ncbi:MAG TPA: helix-hairpin-helix domain-containing protein [Candidatus Aquilonibacter sp.]
MFRALIVLAVAALVGLAIWHPAPAPPLRSTTQALPAPRSRHAPRHFAAPPHLDATVVYVVGAVHRPGLYHLADGARIDDAIRAAGGERGDADPAAVNLAAHTNDGDEIFVPVIGEATPPTMRASRARKPRSRAKTHAVVDVNRASAQILATVPGIGATIAERIVQIRNADGAFTTFDELLDVAGMTQSRLDRARAYLRL